MAERLPGQVCGRFKECLISGEATTEEVRRCAWVGLLGRGGKVWWQKRDMSKNYQKVIGGFKWGAFQSFFFGVAAGVFLGKTDGT